MTKKIKEYPKVAFRVNEQERNLLLRLCDPGETLNAAVKRRSLLIAGAKSNKKTK